MEVAMCDHRTRTWCCRIGLVFTVLGVLSTMIYQIWTYYFYLVEQMDQMTIESPELHAIIRHCNNETFTWQAACSHDSPQNMSCHLMPTQGSETYIDRSSVQGRVDLEGLSLNIETFDVCYQVMVWRLPWAF